MDCKGLRLTVAGLLLVCSLAYGAKASRPNLSGTWVLDRQKSDLRSPPVKTDQPHSTGSGGGGGARTSGGRGTGGGGGGGRGGGGGHGMGGSTPRIPTTYSPMKLDLDFYQIGETADKLTIEHADPAITIKPAVEKGSQEPSPELSYTADSKTHESYMADGGSVQSKTSWEGSELITKSKEKSALGSIEIVEARSLSGDGTMLTISLTYKGISSHWTEKAVYVRQKGDTKSSETSK